MHALKLNQQLEKHFWNDDSSSFISKGEPEVGHAHHLLVFVASLKSHVDLPPQKIVPTLHQLTELLEQLVH